MIQRIATSIVGLILAVGAAHASLVTINTTYDLSNGFVAIVPLDNGPVSIANGDSVVLTVNFSGGLALTIGQGGEDFAGWLFAGDNESIFSIDNALIEFLGFSGSGSASSSYSIGMVNDGAAHLGPRLQGFLGAGESITFTGYQVTYDVLSISQSPHDYAHLFFFALGDQVSIGPAAVPEPTSLALLAIGLASLGARRRKLPGRP